MAEKSGGLYYAVGENRIDRRGRRHRVLQAAEAAKKPEKTAVFQKKLKKFNFFEFRHIT